MKGENDCPKCGSEMEWLECNQCEGNGYSGHDCGEDTCVCRNPQDNLLCESCQAEGGQYGCYACGYGMEV